MPAKGIYLYGIVPNFYGTTQFQSIENSGVYAITFQKISAIVSDRENACIDYLDRETLGYMLVHHQKTIEELQNQGFRMIIPMRLGTIVRSKEEVIKILSNGYDLIIDILKKIEYLTEIDLVVNWADFTTVLKSIAELPDVQEMKTEMIKNNGIIQKVDQCKMGMYIKELLVSKNKAVELTILDALSPFGLDIIMHEVMNDEMVTNSAFLINRAKQDKFEDVIEELDKKYNGALNFKLVGPLPYYSFYTLEVREMDPENVVQATKELGLSGETSESEIKKAYLGKAKLFHPDAHLDNGDDESFQRINKAYHTLLDYSAAVRQSSKQEMISLTKENVLDNLILVKIKE
ncbi:MAG: GvpL/GvpF family gas vesicle protein [Bacteroidota bacterium]